MPYASNTPFYQIPWQNQGENPSAASNQRAAYIIDNQTRAALLFFGNIGILEEGTYTPTFSSGSSSVTLAANGITNAFQGIINNVFANQTTTLSFTQIPDNTKVYLYVLSSETNIYSSTQFSTLQTGFVKPYYNTNGVTPVNSLFLGTATTTSSIITLDVSPTATDNGTFSTGKVYIANFQDHRTQIPIDHPDNSITQSKLQQQSVISKTIAVYDGFTSGTSVLSGTGIASSHIKNKAIQSQHIDSSISISGLTIQSNLVTIPGSSTTFSGVANYTRTPVGALELVNLQTLQNSIVNFGNNFIVGRGTLSSGLGAVTISYPSLLPSVPRYVGVTPEITGSQPPFIFNYITSGTNGGFIAVFNGTTIDNSTIIHYQAIL